MTIINKLILYKHRHLSNIDYLRLVMCPLLTPVFQGFFFAAAINSTNEANKSGSVHHSILLNVFEYNYRLFSKEGLLVYLIFFTSVVTF